MHFFLAVAIPTLPLFLEDYGVVQLYQQNLEIVCDNSSTTPKMI